MLMDKLRHLFKQIKMKLTKDKKPTTVEKHTYLEKMHHDFFNSEEYVRSSTIFHYKKNNSHEAKIIVNSS